MVWCLYSMLIVRSETIQISSNNQTRCNKNALWVWLAKGKEKKQNHYNFDLLCKVLIGEKKNLTCYSWVFQIKLWVIKAFVCKRTTKRTTQKSLFALLLISNSYIVRVPLRKTINLAELGFVNTFYNFHWDGIGFVFEMENILMTSILMFSKFINDQVT